MTILIKVRTDTENEIEEETSQHLKLTDTPENQKETDYSTPHALSEVLNTQYLESTSAEMVDWPLEKEETECAHYFGYVLSGEKSQKSA